MDYSYNNNQYTTTSYGAQGGAGGGGFINTGSQENSGGTSKSYGKDTLRPVTIKQLVDAQQPHPDADFRVDGSEITQITFVGQIRSISQQATNHTYRFDDGTGAVDVKVYIDPESASASNPDKHPTTTTDAHARAPLAESTYARVWGRLKSFNNKKHVGAHVIRPVADHNEVQFHLLEATAVHLAMTRGPPGGGGGGGGGAKEVNGGGFSGPQNGNTVATGTRALPATLSGAARRVYACLNQTPQSNEGLHMQDISVRLGMDTTEVLKAGDDLLSQGLIYTTVDDHTWAVLDEI